MGIFKLQDHLGILYDRKSKEIGRFEIFHISTAVEKGTFFPRVHFKMAKLDKAFYWPLKLTLYSEFGSTYIIPPQSFFSSTLVRDIIWARGSIESDEVQFIRDADRVIHKHRESLFLTIWLVKNQIAGFKIEHFDVTPRIDVSWKAEDQRLRFYGNITNDRTSYIHPASVLEGEIRGVMPFEVVVQVMDLLNEEPAIATQIERILTQK